MDGPDTYDVDEGLMDELGGAMDDYDAKKVHPVVIEISIHPGGKPEEPKEAESDGDVERRPGMLPTPEEIEEMLKEAQA
jgi:hypothetical protein